MIYSQDWHPTNHISFFSNLGLRTLDPTWLSENNKTVEDIKMYDEVQFERDPPSAPYKETLWPDHCIQGTWGEKREDIRTHIQLI